MWELVKSGGWMMLPIILCSIAAAGIIAERLWTLRPARITPSHLLGQVWLWIKDKQLTSEKLKTLRADSPLGEILAAGLANSRHGREIMKECIEEAAARVIHELERYLNALGTIAAMLLWTLVRYRSQDTYRDNAFFMVMLPAFLIAKYLMLYGNNFSAGYAMAIGLFRLAFLVMLERTLTGFMKAAFQTSILRQPKLDMPIKLLGLLLVIEPFLPRPLTAGLSLALAVLLAVRFVFWKPQLAFKRIDIGIMYVGYLAIVGQLLIEALGHVVNFVWVGSVSVHLFTFGAMGCVIPAMIMRISKGHTGRKVVFDGLDRALLYVMIAALAIRIVIPQFAPGAYLACIHAAATCWLLAFGILAWRYIPLLMQARIDGREH